MGVPLACCFPFSWLSVLSGHASAQVDGSCLICFSSHEGVDPCRDPGTLADGELQSGPCSTCRELKLVLNTVWDPIGGGICLSVFMYLYSCCVRGCVRACRRACGFLQLHHPCCSALRRAWCGTQSCVSSQRCCAFSPIISPYSFSFTPEGQVNEANWHCFHFSIFYCWKGNKAQSYLQL